MSSLLLLANVFGVQMCPASVIAVTAMATDPG